MGEPGSTDNAVEKVAHKLGIPWPSAEEGQLRRAADAFDAAASALDAEAQRCTAQVRSLSAGNSGGGMEEFATFWTRYDGGGSQGAMPSTAQACRDMARACREYASQVERTKTSIRHQVEIAGAALVVGAVAAIFTFGASEAAAVAAAAALAEVASGALAGLVVAVGEIVTGVLVGAVFGAVESVAIDALVVQPMSAALGEQEGFSFDELLHAAEYGGLGGAFAGGLGGGLSRLPALAGRAEAAGLPRLADTLDGLTSFTGTTAGRLTTGALMGGGGTEVVSGGRANPFEVLTGALGGMAGAGAGRRGSDAEGPSTSRTTPEGLPAGGASPEEVLPPRLVRDDDDFTAPLNYRGVQKAQLDPEGNLVPANPEGLTTVPQHVIGDNSTPDVKGNSSYISFKPPDNTGKSFGATRMELDLVRLKADADAGLLPGVRVLSPEQVQAELHQQIDGVAGRHVEVPERFADADDQAHFFEAEGMTGKAGRELRQLVKALQNTLRDDEWLIQGTIPARYLFGPYANTTP